MKELRTLGMRLFIITHTQLILFLIIRINAFSYRVNFISYIYLIRSELTIKFFCFILFRLVTETCFYFAQHGLYSCGDLKTRSDTPEFVV